jgi:tripeptide aminopeptidase
MTTTTSRLVDTFLKLAAIRSPAREEGDCALWVRGYLEALGLEVEEDGGAETIPAGCGNLTVRIPGTVEGTPIFLCSHLDTVALADDVVPVLDEQTGIITNEREAILGGDNKAAVAVMLELVREIVGEGIDHAGLEVVFTPCEEIGLLGAKAYDASSLTATFGYVFDHAKAIGGIVVEAPSQVSIRATFTGRPSHSGIAPEEGRNAIRAAAAAIADMPHGRIDERSTANVGLIRGGSAVNIVPEHCELRAEVRSLDHATAGDLAKQSLDACMTAGAMHDVTVDVDLVDEYRAYAFREASPPVKHAVAALEAAGYEPTLIPCGGGSDANVFNAAGKPCVNLCNGMQLIHTPDECIHVDDLEGMLRVARALVSGAVANPAP